MRIYAAQINSGIPTIQNGEAVSTFSLENTICIQTPTIKGFLVLPNLVNMGCELSQSTLAINRTSYSEVEHLY